MQSQAALPTDRLPLTSLAHLPPAFGRSPQPGSGDGNGGGWLADRRTLRHQTPPNLPPRNGFVQGSRLLPAAGPVRALWWALSWSDDMT